MNSPNECEHLLVRKLLTLFLNSHVELKILISGDNLVFICVWYYEENYNEKGWYYGNVCVIVIFNFLLNIVHVIYESVCKIL